jgi:hypothetical protein
VSGTRGGKTPSASGDDVAGRRRRAVLAGHRGDGEGAGALLGDGDPSVRAAALGALGRLGAVDDALLLGAFADPEPAVRRRACALVGGSANHLSAGDELMAGLVALMDEPDTSVAETAAWALG